MKSNEKNKLGWFVLLSLVCSTMVMAQERLNRDYFTTKSHFISLYDAPYQYHIPSHPFRVSILNTTTEMVYTNSFNETQLYIESERIWQQNIGSKLQFKMSYSIVYGRNTPLLTIQDYIPNTSEVTLYGALNYALSPSIMLQSSYQWNSELEIANDPAITMGGPLLANIAVTYLFGSWQFQLAAMKLTNFPWDGSVFDIENQELGEFQAIEETVFRPDRSLSLYASITVMF